MADDFITDTFFWDDPRLDDADPHVITLLAYLKTPVCGNRGGMWRLSPRAVAMRIRATPPEVKAGLEELARLGYIEWDPVASVVYEPRMAGRCLKLAAYLVQALKAMGDLPEAHRLRWAQDHERYLYKWQPPKGCVDLWTTWRELLHRAPLEPAGTATTEPAGTGGSNTRPNGTAPNGHRAKFGHAEPTGSHRHDPTGSRRDDPNGSRHPDPKGKDQDQREGKESETETETGAGAEGPPDGPDLPAPGPDLAPGFGADVSTLAQALLHHVNTHRDKPQGYTTQTATCLTNAIQYARLNGWKVWEELTAIVDYCAMSRWCYSGKGRLEDQDKFLILPWVFGRGIHATKDKTEDILSEHRANAAAWRRRMLQEAVQRGRIYDPNEWTAERLRYWQPDGWVQELDNRSETYHGPKAHGGNVH